MKIGFTYFAVLFFSLFAIFSYADQEAITSKGEAVILKDDGTWTLKTKPTETDTHDDHNFRNASWGMSREQVKAAENGIIKADNDVFIGYDGNVMGMDVMILYIFADDKLVRAKYLFVEEHSNKNDYIKDYKQIQQALSKKYATPNKDETLWKNDLYRDDFPEWGMAVAVGHLAYFSKWETDDTNIILYLGGDNYKIELAVEYASKSLQQLEEKLKEEKQASQL